MTQSTLALVFASTITHAWWNFLLKRSGGSQAFVALSKVAEVVLLGPVFVWVMLHEAPLGQGAWTLVVVGAMLVLLNYAALAKAYSTGHLSVVYPISRGSVLFVLPVLGFLVFDERISALGGSGMLLIVCGILVLTLREFRWQAVKSFWNGLSTPATGFALAAAGCTALYTIWDKRAVNAMPVFLYFYAYTVVVAVLYLAVIRMRYTSEQIGAEWRAQTRSVVTVGALNAITYLMVLFALRSGATSSVVAIRQLSIAWSVVLGIVVLREPRRAPMLVGALMVLIGCGLTALGR